MARKYVISCYDEKPVKELETMGRQLEKRLKKLRDVSEQGVEYLDKRERRIQRYVREEYQMDIILNDQASDKLSEIAQRVEKLTSDTYYMRMAVDPEDALGTLQALEKGRQLFSGNMKPHIAQPSWSGEYYGTEASTMKQPQDWEQKFQKDPFGSAYEGGKEFASAVNIFSAAKNLREFNPVKAFDKKIALQLPKSVEKMTALIGKSKTLSKVTERVATTRIGQSAAAAVANIPEAAAAGTLSTGLGLATVGARHWLPMACMMERRHFMKGLPVRINMIGRMI